MSQKPKCQTNSPRGTENSGLDLGNDSPTIREVAKEAQVALSSVSRVLNNHPDVSDDMRQRVLSAIEIVGYRPNLIASSLRRGLTYTIGFLVSDIANPLFADFVKGASRRLHDSGYSIILADSGDDPRKEVDMIRLFRGRRVDGLIASLVDEERVATTRELARLDIPIVLLDRQVHSLPNTSMVIADHATGMLHATKHLLELGHRHIGLISGSRRITPTKERVRGYKAAFQNHGIPHRDDLIRLGSFSPEFGYRATTDLLSCRNPPTAIISGGNLLLTGTLRALQNAERKVGQDLALISCDDVPLGEFYSPPLTVIGRDTIHMGELAAALMINSLSVPDAPPRSEYVATALIIRQSTYRLT